MSERMHMKNTIFTFRDNSPKYKQIYEKFKSYIEHGDIKADELLPSIRQLADSLHVSRNTTLMAYEQLVAEGYIRGEGRKGYFVNELEPLLFHEGNCFPAHKQTEMVPASIDFPRRRRRSISFSLKNMEETLQSSINGKGYLSIRRTFRGIVPSRANRSLPIPIAWGENRSTGNHHREQYATNACVSRTCLEARIS